MTLLNLFLQSWRSVPPFAFGDPSLRSGTGSTMRQLWRQGASLGGGLARPPPFNKITREIDDNSSV